MTEITDVEAWEVLDSRGNPTVRARVEVGESTGTFTVPAGASTGAHEAVERRDGGERFTGMGVRKAVAAVEDELAPVAVGRDATDQAGLDAALEARDGADDLSNLGANAVLAVSGAAAHGAAAALDVPLYEHLAPDAPGRLPLPMVNVLSGGLHAEGGVEIQDFLVVPVGADSYPAAIEMAWKMRAAVRERIVDAGHRPLVADEGGFAPPLDGIDDAFDLLLAGIRHAGLAPGADVALAVDVAATHFHDGGTYGLGSVGRRLDRDSMIDLVAGWLERYPIVSIEDPLAEDDWEGWARLAERVGDDVQLLGDDLLATNVDRIGRAVDAGAANAALIKPNQAGTLTRAIDAAARAVDAGWAPVVSARSGETCDATIADLAVGLDAGQIKVGSLARSERLAKYNRLLEIARVRGGYAGPDGLAAYS